MTISESLSVTQSVVFFAHSTIMQHVQYFLQQMTCVASPFDQALFFQRLPETTTSAELSLQGIGAVNVSPRSGLVFCLSSSRRRRETFWGLNFSQIYIHFYPYHVQSCDETPCVVHFGLLSGSF